MQIVLKVFQLLETFDNQQNTSRQLNLERKGQLANRQGRLHNLWRMLQQGSSNLDHPML